MNYDFKKLVMKALEIDSDEFNQLMDEAYERFGDGEDAEELYNELIGLEPDYIIDFMDYLV